MPNKLLKLSLIISLLGILFLLFLTNNLKPTQINNYHQLSQLKLNQLVTTTSKIISVYSKKDFHIIKLDNNITLTFNSNFNSNQFQNKTITATGKLTTYKNQLQLQAETIKIGE